MAEVRLLLSLGGAPQRSRRDGDITGIRFTKLETTSAFFSSASCKGQQRQLKSPSGRDTESQSLGTMVGIYERAVMQMVKLAISINPYSPGDIVLLKEETLLHLTN